MRKVCPCGTTCHRTNQSGLCWLHYWEHRRDQSKAKQAEDSARFALVLLARIMVRISDAVEELARAETALRESDRVVRYSRHEWIVDLARTAGVRPVAICPRNRVHERVLRIFVKRGDVVLSGSRGTIVRRAWRGHIIAARPQEGARS